MAAEAIAFAPSRVACDWTLPTMLDFSFKLNPPATELSKCSALLNGVATQYRVESYRTTLSVKAVQRGAALYATRRGRHLVTEDCFLILNEGQEYSLEFQWPAPTETLCPFFQPGFLEQTSYCLTTPVSKQLDQLDAPTCSAGFCERLYPRTGPVAVLLDELHRGVRAGRATAFWLEDRFHELAAALVQLQANASREMDDLSALRPATRQELYRRLHRGRDYLSSCYASPVTVTSAAKAASLSPAHFHRQFKALFRQTPMQFLQERRLAAARRLLTSTDEPVTTVCLMVGLESLGSFCSLFHRRFGCSPSRYRQAHKPGPKKQP
jgi:AraC family transcriptional regulator